MIVKTIEYRVRSILIPSHVSYDHHKHELYRFCLRQFGVIMFLPSNVVFEVDLLTAPHNDTQDSFTGVKVTTSLPPPPWFDYFGFVRTLQCALLVNENFKYPELLIPHPRAGYNSMSKKIFVFSEPLDYNEVAQGFNKWTRNYFEQDDRSMNWDEQQEFMQGYFYEFHKFQKDGKIHSITFSSNDDLCPEDVVIERAFDLLCWYGKK
jgi:hypothetical protein